MTAYAPFNKEKIMVVLAGFFGLVVMAAMFWCLFKFFALLGKGFIRYGLSAFLGIFLGVIVVFLLVSII